MYQFTYYPFPDIALDVTIDIGDIDKFDPITGHYTEPGDPFIVAAMHNGQDILEILLLSVVDDILDQYEMEVHFGDV